MKKLFTAPQIRAWDSYTIKHTPITSIHLMENASTAFVNWFAKKYNTTQSVYITCGSGNNGGDGLVICRLLNQKGFRATPFFINPNDKITIDCQVQLDKTEHIKDWIAFQGISIRKTDIIIDAIFGIGLTRSIEGDCIKLIQILNDFDCIKIAVDIPSGMYSNKNNIQSDIIFKADEVLTFQIPKRTFFYSENKPFIKSFTVADIGLHALFYKQTHCNWFQITNTNQIPYFNNYEVTIMDTTNFESTYPIPYTTDYAIVQLTQKAITERKIMMLDAYSKYYLTPKGNIYIILN